MKYAAAIFDFDDTLVKTRETKWAQHKQVAKQFYDLDLTDETLHAHWGKPYDETLRQFYNNADTIENMRAAKLSLEDQFPIEAQEGAVELLVWLVQAGLTVGVLSSSTRSLVAADLERLGFPVASLCRIQTSEDTLAHKPDPAVFRPMLDALTKQGITEGIVYIGDALRDWQAAHAAGIDFIGVTTDLTDRATFAKAGVLYIAPDMHSVRNYFIVD